MAINYTPKHNLANPDYGEEDWDVPKNDNTDKLDNALPPQGGNAESILQKVSSANYDYQWIEKSALIPFQSIRKNFVKNGCFKVAQRGATGITNSSENWYGMDMWRVESVGSSSTSWDQIAGPGSWMYESGYAMQLYNSEGNPRKITQYIEHMDSIVLKDKTVTLSFKGVFDESFAIDIYKVIPGAIDDYTTPTTALLGSVVMDQSSGATYSLTFDLTQNEVSSGIGFQFYYAASSEYIILADVQLEIGDKATEFEYRPYSEELAMCQGYYRILACSYALYVPTSATVGRMQNFTLSPEMRVSPTPTYSDFSAGGGATGVTLTADKYVVAARVDGSGMTTNAANYVTFNMQLSAEIK